MVKKRQIAILTMIVEELQKNSNTEGICKVINKLLSSQRISLREHFDINRFIEDNKPTPKNEYKEFTENEYWVGSIYWWKVMWFYPLTRRIRIAYINKLIENIK